MTKEEFKACVYEAFHANEHWEQFLECVGQLYVDNSPHWISVEDELPNFFDNVLYCDEDGDYYTETDNIGEDVKITHWMHIPDCPPLQDFDNRLKALLDGKSKKGGEQ